MADLYIKENTHCVQKPFSLCLRSFEGIDVEWTTICDLSEYSANLLIEKKAFWYNAEPDWDKHYKRVALLEATIAMKKAQKEYDNS